MHATHKMGENSSKAMTVSGPLTQTNTKVTHTALNTHRHAAMSLSYLMLLLVSHFGSLLSFRANGILSLLLTAFCGGQGNA